MKIDENDYLVHYGILGMKWGVRRYQNEDGSLTEEGKIHYANKNLKKSYNKNFEKWGKDPEHNVLYLTGASGSGKSTTALGLTKDGDSVIHIDALLDDKAHETASNLDFESFCSDYGIDASRARNTKLSMTDRIKTLDDISNLIEDYGKKCYSENRKVIVEGVQLAEETMFPDKKYFDDKPIVILNTGKTTSAIRASLRDNASIKDAIKDIFDKDRSAWYDKIDTATDELKHYGIKGQKWGVRRYQDSNGEWTPEGLERRRAGNGHAKRLLNYDGPAYFISEKKLDEMSLLPRVPKNFFTENGYEDAETPRVSFAPSVDECLAGLSQNVEDKTFYVYEPTDISKCEMAKPDSKAVPDSKITNELWCLNAVDVHQVGKIHVTGNRGEEGKKFTYGDHEAELYNDWEYEFK